MVEEVAKNIFRIGVTLPNNPLKELNSYLIRGADREILIDTGFRCDECRQALENGLREVGSDPTRRDLLITHIHSDHSGMADQFAGPGRYVYMSQIDLNHHLRICNGEISNYLRNRFLTEGFSEELVDYIQTHNPARIMALPEISAAFRGLRNGDIISVGDYQLKLLQMPGHTPGNTMFWAEAQGIMFTGDHILFDITPNITVWPEMEDSLGTYIDSLQHAHRFPVRQALPGHRKSGDYHARIDELLRHHEIRLQEALRIITEQPGQTAYEITGQMTWQIRSRSWSEFPPVQKWFAVGECLAHLDYLRKRGKIRCRLINGMWRYEAV